MKPYDRYIPYNDLPDLPPAREVCQIIREAKEPASRLDILRLFVQPYIRPKNLLSDRIKSVNTAKKLSHEKMGNEHIWINTELMEILGD